MGEITQVIELNVTPFGRGMFAKGVVWASERTAAERKALLKYEAAQRRNAAKATAVRMAKTKARDARLLARYRELTKTMKRQTGNYLTLADEFGLSEHRVSEIIRRDSARRKKRAVVRPARHLHGKCRDVSACPVVHAAPKCFYRDRRCSQPFDVDGLRGNHVEEPVL